MKKFFTCFLVTILFLTSVNIDVFKASGIPEINNQTDYYNWLKLIGYPTSINGKQANWTVYRDYNQIVYGNPFGRYKNDSLCGNNSEYENLGYGRTNNIVTNSCFPEDAYAGTHPKYWNYQTVDNASTSWDKADQIGMTNYIKSSNWTGNGATSTDPMRYSYISSESKVRIDNFPTWRGSGAVYTKNKGKSGKIYYATFDVPPLADSSKAIVDGDINTDSDTYTIDADDDSVTAKVTVSSEALISGFMQYSQVSQLKAAFGAQSNTTSGKQYSIYNGSYIMSRSQYSVGTHQITLRATSSLKTVYGDGESKPLAKQITLIVKGPTKPTLTASGSTNPSIKQFKQGETLTDVSIKVKVSANLQNVDSSKITSWSLSAFKEGETSGTQRKSITGLSAKNVNQSYTFTFTVPKSKFTNGSYTQYFRVAASATLSNGKTLTSESPTLTDIYPPNATPPAEPSIPDVNPEPINLPPTVNIFGPNSVKAGDDLDLRSNPADSDGLIVSQLWDTPGSIYSISGMNGTLNYSDIGTYFATTTVYDDKGASANASHQIEVLPPIPESKFTVSGFLKENRKVDIEDESTSTKMFPIDYANSTWEITAVDPANQDAIFTNGNLNGDKNLSVLFKKKGQYKIKRYVINTKGYDSTSEQTITISEDLKPTADFTAPPVVYRDKKSDVGNIAVIGVSDSSFSEDDIIAKRIWTVKFDSNNDGSFDDEASQVLNGDDVNIQFIEYNALHVGKYLFELQTTEEFGQPTIDNFVTESDRRNDDTQNKVIQEKIVEVKNLPPSVAFEASKQRKANLNVIAGNNPNSSTINDKINTILRPLLAAENIELNLNTNGLATGKIHTRKSYENGWNSLNGSPFGAPTLDVKIPNGFDPLGVAGYNNQTFGYSTNVPIMYVINRTSGRLKFRKANESTWSDLNSTIVDVAIPSGYKPLGVMLNYELTQSQSENAPYIYIINPSNGNINYRQSTDSNWRSLYSSYGDNPVAVPIPSGYVPLGIAPSKENSFAYCSNIPVMYIVNKTTGDILYRKAFFNIWVSLNKQWVTNQNYQSYNSGGYSGTLTQYVASGYYSPSNSYTQTSSLTSSTQTGFPSGISYNDGTYSGTLYQSGSAYVISGLAPDTKYVTASSSGSTSSSWTWYGYWSRSGSSYSPGSYSYNSGGYSGSLSVTNASPDAPTPSSKGTKNGQTTSSSTGTSLSFGGNATRPDTRTWQQNYSGTVTCPSVDTRVFKYQGFVTKTTPDATSPIFLPVEGQYEPIGVILDSTTYNQTAPNVPSVFFINTSNDIAESNDNVNVFKAVLEDQDISTNTQNIINSQLKVSHGNLIGLGTDANQSTFQNMITANNNKGIFIKNSDIDSAITSMADYIIQEINTNLGDNVLYVTLDEPVTYSTYFNDVENDPKYTENNNTGEHWKYIHDPNVFENSMGYFSSSNNYLDKPITSFNKTGLYTVSFSAKDNPVGNEDAFDNYRLWSNEVSNFQIYVHRKPIADFSFNLNKSTGDYTITNRAYDLDKQSVNIGYGGGIQSLTYQWRYQGDDIWNDGLPPKPLKNEIYDVRQEVYDFQGANASIIKSLDTTGINKAPVADFIPIPDIVRIGSNVALRNLSYDPNGDALTAKWWISPKGQNNFVLMSTIYEPTQQMNTLGDFDIKLRVTDPFGAFAEVTKSVTVIPKNQPPFPGMEFDSPKYIGDTNIVTSTATDPDNDSLTYKYTLQKGSNVLTYQSGDPEVDSNGNLTIRFTDANDIGDWQITQTVNDGTVSVSSEPKTLTILDLFINGKVLHTPEWENIHLQNGDATGDFYSGEEFLLEADVVPQPIDKVMVNASFALADGTTINKEVILNRSTDSLYNSSLMDQLFIDPLTSINKGPVTFHFIVYYSNGITRENSVNVQIIGNAMEILKLHRTF